MTSARQNTPGNPSHQEALGQSEAFLSFMEALSQAAKVDRPILILGERGTGKELAASRLHFLSRRWQEPFVTLNCAALTHSLIESELFGHEAGAFTGAQGRRAGRFEAADKGSLFLDEIGNTPLTVQEKLLRAVEYGVFERVGGSQPVQVDVRIIGATNKDLASEAAAGRFARDLLDRLSFEVLAVPPLRQRQGDVAFLTGHFARRMAVELGWDQAPEFSPTALEQLEDHSWPGNVRELKNVVERSVYRGQGARIERIDFGPFCGGEPGAPSSPSPADAQAAPAQSSDCGEPAPDFKSKVLAYEKRLLSQAMQKNQYKQKAAADDLGLSYHQLRNLIRKHGGLENL